jgi:hypothetical protein
MPPDCQCLPCTLSRALIAWQAKHYLSTEGTVDQLGRFVSKAIADLPEYQGHPIGIAILDAINGEFPVRLH